MGVDLAADVERDLDGVGDEAVALELHLPAGDVEAGDQLLVGRGRGVGEDRLVELRLDVAEVDVLDEEHRALAQRRHRLVGGVGLVDPQPHLARVRDQPRGEELLLRRIVAELGLLALPGLDRRRVGDPRLDRLGGAHRGARPEERRPAGEAEPGLVPEEDQVRLDGEAFLHHPAGVVDVAVEGAVGEVDHLRPVEPALGLEGEERLLDAGERHRAVHRVFRHREGVDVERLAAGQHQAVVVRLVAVAVEQHDVAGRDQRLVHHLVRGAGAVGDEEDVVGAEGARRHRLRLLDVAGRLQQAVEAAGRGARFGEEDVQPVELAHVADPVGLEHRLAAGDRQRVEGADRAHRVLLQVVEERRAEAVGDAFEDARGAAPAAPRPNRARGGCRRRGDRRRSAPRGGPTGGRRRGRGAARFRPAASASAMSSPATWSASKPAAASTCAERGRVVARGVGEALVDRDAGDDRVEQDGADRVLEAADRHRLVDEGVLRPAQAAQLGHLLRPAVGGAGRDDEHLEVGPVPRLVPHRRGIELGRRLGELLGGLPGAGVVLVGPGQDRLGDPPRRGSRPPRRRRSRSAGAGSRSSRAPG